MVSAPGIFLWGRLAEFEVIEATGSAGVVAARGGQGFAIDQKDKAAVENRAMCASASVFFLARRSI